jgi:tetratricopeptide (TPR) repeat protein
VNRLDEAVRALEQAIALEPRLPALHAELVEAADLAWQQGAEMHAADLYQSALNLTQDSDEPLVRARAQLGLSRVLLKQGQTEAARDAAHRAVKSAEGRDDQVYTDAIYQRALALMAAGDMATAARDFATCAPLYETLGQGRMSVRAHYQRAVAAPDLKSRRSAIEAALKKMDAALDVFNAEDAQLRRDIIALNEILKEAPAEEAPVPA